MIHMLHSTGLSISIWLHCFILEVGCRIVATMFSRACSENSFVTLLYE